MLVSRRKILNRIHIHCRSKSVKCPQVSSQHKIEMGIRKYNCFVAFVSVIFISLAAYGVIGLTLNGLALEQLNFRGTWPLNEKCGIIVLMIAEAIFLFIASIGLVGVICRSFIGWYIPGFLLLGTGVALLSFGGATLRASWKNLEHLILRAIQTANGTRADEYLSWMSSVQWEHDCCGISSYKDYLQLHFPSLSAYSVPQSCCDRSHQIPSPECGEGILSPGNSVENIEAVLIRNGCGVTMSQIQGGVLNKLGTEMLIVGFLALLFAFLLYGGVFTIVVAEYTDMAEGEEPVNEEARDRMSQNEITSTTAPHNFTNTNTGVVRNGNNRRVFRTRRHGGGESIVSFAMDLENNNQDGRARPMVVGNQAASRGRKVVQSRGKPRSKIRNQYSRQVQGARCGKAKGQVSRQGHGKTYFGTKMVAEDLHNTMEMLLKPRDNNSIISTTPYHSSQNFITYFRQNQRPTDSDTNLTSSTQRPPMLTHYSSLPHVYSPSVPTTTKNMDPKSKAMAELKQRFPPGAPNINPGKHPPPPPATSQTQHHHYYRIPVAVIVTPPPQSTETQPFVDGKFPSVAAESNLDTIQEESAENTRTGFSNAPITPQHISIFEVFEELENSPEVPGNQNKSDSQEDPFIGSFPKILKTESVSSQTEEKFREPITVEIETPADSSRDFLGLNETMAGIEESLDQNCKIEAEKMEAISIQT